MTVDEALVAARADAALLPARAGGAVRADATATLAGVSFAAKDLFDVAGRTTLAGSIVNAADPPAARNATAIARLEAAGAVLVGLTNMDEYAYGFSTENAHTGATRNPHDCARIAGGSSGGSAAAVAAVAAVIVPLSLGSDTNGSIRVPASLCGVWGLKPTFGRLSRGGSYLCVADLDHIGSFARDLAMLAAAYDALQGTDARDPTTFRFVEGWPDQTTLNQQGANPAFHALLAEAQKLAIVEFSADVYDIASMQPVALPAD